MNIVKRMQHAGAKMKINGKIFIVVVGPSNTVEILDTSSPNNGWEFGENFREIDFIERIPILLFTVGQKI